MSLIQVELIRRKRAAAPTHAGSAELNRAISATINGISAGLAKYGLKSRGSSPNASTSLCRFYVTPAPFIPNFTGWYQ